MLKTQRVEKTLLSFITVPERRRTPSPEQVSLMAASLNEFGLLTPIGIREVGGGFVPGVLVYGATRLAAAKQLGWEEIDTAILEGDEIDFRKAEIVENLHRAELTALERAEWTAALVELCAEELSQVAKDRPGPKGATHAAAQELGIGKDRVYRDTKIAAIKPEAKDAARAAGLADNQRALLAVAKEPTAEAQVAKVEEIMAAKEEKPKRHLKRAERKVEAATAADGAVPEDARQDAADAAAEIIQQPAQIESAVAETAPQATPLQGAETLPERFRDAWEMFVEPIFKQMSGEQKDVAVGWLEARGVARETETAALVPAMSMADLRAIRLPYGPECDMAQETVWLSHLVDEIERRYDLATAKAAALYDLLVECGDNAGAGQVAKSFAIRTDLLGITYRQAMVAVETHLYKKDRKQYGGVIDVWSRSHPDHTICGEDLHRNKPLLKRIGLWPERGESVAPPAATGSPVVGEAA